MRPLDPGEQAIVEAWRREHPDAPEWWIHERAIDRVMHERVIAREQSREKQTLERWHQRARHKTSWRDAMHWANRAS